MIKIANENDLREIMLEAQAEVAEAMREVARDMALPQMVDTFRRTWTQLPQKMKEKFQKEKPEDYKALMELFQ